MLVREGSRDPAIVRVTLLNTGSDAYKPALYGDRITIERKISAGLNGASKAAGYRLLDSNGKVFIIF